LLIHSHFRGLISLRRVFPPPFHGSICPLLGILPFTHPPRHTHDNPPFSFVSLFCLFSLTWAQCQWNPRLILLSAIIPHHPPSVPFFSSPSPVNTGRLPFQTHHKVRFSFQGLGCFPVDESVFVQYPSRTTVSVTTRRYLRSLPLSLCPRGRSRPCRTT